MHKTYTCLHGLSSSVHPSSSVTSRVVLHQKILSPPPLILLLQGGTPKHPLMNSLSSSRFAGISPLLGWSFCPKISAQESLQTLPWWPRKIVCNLIAVLAIWVRRFLLFLDCKVTRKCTQMFMSHLCVLTHFCLIILRYWAELPATSSLTYLGRNGWRTK